MANCLDFMLQLTLYFMVMPNDNAVIRRNGLQAASKYSLAKAPKLVDIISAVPEEQRAILLPRYSPAWQFPALLALHDTASHGSFRVTGLNSRSIQAVKTKKNGIKRTMQSQADQ